MTYPYHRHGTKQLNEHLSPLKRYIQSKVGEPWDEVFSEICKNLKMDSAVQAHVRDHADMMVAKDVQVFGNAIFDSAGLKIYSYNYHHCFYVDPKTGILKVTPKEGRKKWKHDDNYVVLNMERVPFDKLHTYIRPVKSRRVKIDRLHSYIQMEDIWYLITFVEIPAKPNIAYWGTLRYPRDILMDEECSPGRAHRVYGDTICAVDKKQIGKREIKKLEKLL